jgi:hypothetical protein
MEQHSLSYLEENITILASPHVSHMSLGADRKNGCHDEDEWEPKEDSTATSN